MRGFSSRASFTLIELLVVVAIVTILAVVVVLTLNPAQLLKQARDSTRASDFATINQALSFFQTDVVGGNMGSTSTISISIADSSATCANLGLPALPSGYTYRCVTSANLQKVDGSGWIPVDFTQISSGSPLGTLPVDPVNSTSTGNYYTFIPGGSWELTALMESQKYATNEAADGGVDPATYETGSNLALSPFAHGMVGYWKLDEGTGTTAADSSGYGDSGTLTNGPSWQSGCKQGGCLSFDGVNDYVGIPDAPQLNFPNKSFTILAWAYINATSTSHEGIVTKYNGGPPRYWLRFTTASECNYRFSAGAQAFGGQAQSPACASGALNGWHFVAAWFDVTTNTMNLQVDGGSVATATMSSPGNISQPLYLGAVSDGGVGYFLNGSVDDVRIYSRALSAAEISAIYNAAK